MIMFVAGAKNSSVTETMDPPIAELARSTNRQNDKKKVGDHKWGAYRCIDVMGKRLTLHEQYVGKKGEPLCLDIVKVKKRRRKSSKKS